MIVDIENRGEYLKVSHFTEEGDLAFLDVPIPESERFVWEKCSPSNSAKDKEWKTWTGDSVKKLKTQSSIKCESSL
jgi:hypothetical protein